MEIAILLLVVIGLACWYIFVYKKDLPADVLKLEQAPAVTDYYSTGATTITIKDPEPVVAQVDTITITTTDTIDLSAIDTLVPTTGASTGTGQVAKTEEPVKKTLAKKKPATKTKPAAMKAKNKKK